MLPNRIAVFTAQRTKANNFVQIGAALIRGFMENGVKECDLVLLNATDADRRSFPGVNIISLGVEHSAHSVGPLYKYIRLCRPNLIFPLDPFYNIPAVVANRLARAGTKVVMTVHNILSSESSIDHPNDLRWQLLPLLVRSTYPFGHGIIGVAQDVIDDLVDTVKVSRRIPMTSIPIPVDLERIERLAKEPVNHPWFADNKIPVFLTVARLAKQKQLDLLLRAFSRVLQKRPARLLVLGEGYLRVHLEELCRELRVQESVMMPGYAANPYSVMARCDAFVMSSAWEGCPVALIEAMACGTAVIVNDAPGGAKDVAGRGAYGLVAQAGNADSLAESMLRIVCDSELKQHFQQQSRLRSAEFGHSKISRRYLDFYQSLTEKKRHVTIPRGKQACRPNCPKPTDAAPAATAFSRAEGEIPPRRVTVLLSAYSCGPGHGSEPEVGWQTAISLSQFCNVKVLTIKVFKDRIEKSLQGMQNRNLDFLYFDLPVCVTTILFKLPFSLLTHYFMWQLFVRDHVKKERILDQIDIIHHLTYCQFSYPGFWMATGKPYVLGPLGGTDCVPRQFYSLLSFRERLGEELRNRMKERLIRSRGLRAYFMNANRVMFANASIASKFSGIDSVTSLETAVDPTIITPKGTCPAHTGLRIIWAGSLDYRKGLIVLLEALTKLDRPDVTLDIYGAGSKESEYKQFVNGMRRGACVALKGRIPRTELLKLYRAYDVFVFTSLRDTSGNVLLEAMAAGLPSIYLDHQGAKDIMADSRAGIGIEPRDPGYVVDKLADAITHYLDKPEMMAVHGRNAQDHVRKNFTWRGKAAGLSALYQEIVENANSSTQGRGTHSRTVNSVETQ